MDMSRDHHEVSDKIASLLTKNIDNQLFGLVAKVHKKDAWLTMIDVLSKKQCPILGRIGFYTHPIMQEKLWWDEG